MSQLDVFRRSLLLQQLLLRATVTHWCLLVVLRRSGFVSLASDHVLRSFAQHVHNFALSV